MSANNSRKKAIKQNVSKMACDIYDELKRQVNHLKLGRRLRIAFSIICGRW